MTDDLIEKFFRKECTPEEEQRVREYFRQHLSDLENLTEEDWATFHYKEPLPAFVSDKMLSVIEHSTHPRKTIRIFFRYAAAAAVAGLCIAAWMWANHSHHSGTPAIASQPAPAPAPQHHWTEKANRTGKTIQLTLPDSSIVALASQSSIRYEDSFTRDTRAIYLTGKAMFTVATDHVRPFTVHAGGLSTTALATVFSVSCTGDNNMATEVSLISGKVVVRGSSIKETFLHPGELLRFDPLKQTVSVQAQRIPLPIRPANPPVERIMQFNDTPLKDIFQSLEKEYHCRVIYDNPDIDSIRFTGSFNKNKETLSDFLNTIALLNNLTLTEKNTSFYLK